MPVMDQDAQQPSVMDTLRDIQQTQSHLLAAVESLSIRIATEAPIPDGRVASPDSLGNPFQPAPQDKIESLPLAPTSDSTVEKSSHDDSLVQAASPGQKSGFTSRIVLTWVLPCC